jgi:FkbM family methyltransferase
MQIKIPTIFPDIAAPKHLNKIARRFMRPTSDCEDVGAHKSSMLKLFASKAPDGIHYAIEPVPDLMQHLKSKFGSYRNIRFEEKAIGANVDHQTFMYVLTKPSLSGLQKRPLPKRAEAVNILVQTTTLDELLPGDYRLDLLKIDVCGGEQQVLLGGMEKLKDDRPLILFRHYHKELSCYDSEPGKTYQMVTGELGYRVYSPKSFLQGQPPLSQSMFEATFWKGNDKYFVAVPPSR